MKTKKMNSYIKLAIILLLSAVAGGVIGFLGGMIMDKGGEHIGSAFHLVIIQFQRMMLPIMVLLTVVSVVFGEMNLQKQKALCKKILETEDEECDRWEYEEEKSSAWGVTVNTLSMVLCVLVLSGGYSARYLESGHNRSFLIVCLVFLACYAYDGFWQVRYIKVIQSAYPEKQGDPASPKFQQQWLESCDEAEKEIIYQSAYKSYIRVGQWIPALLLVTMLGQLFLNTGVLAIIVVAVIWLVVTVTYVRSCVKLRAAKLR